MSTANTTLLVPQMGSEPDTFAGLCSVIRHRVDALEMSFVRESLAIADMLIAAKAQYERETGTGHGKGKGSGVIPFVRRVADEIGRSPGFVKRLLALTRIDAETRRVIENAQGVSMAALLDVAREADVDKRLKAATALVEGGRAAMKEAMSPLAERRTTDPAFDALLKSIMDPTETFGGLPDQMAVPPGFVNVYPELAAYETMGDLRAAIKSGKVSRGGRRQQQDVGVVEAEAPTADGLSHEFMRLSDSEQDRFLRLVGATWQPTVLGVEDVIDVPEPGCPAGPSLRVAGPNSDASTRGGVARPMPGGETGSACAASEAELPGDHQHMTQVFDLVMGGD